MGQKLTEKIYLTLSWLKNPYNIALILVLILTLFIRTRFMFQESIWVDETHYLVYGPRLLNNPLELFSDSMSNNTQFPLILIAILSFFFDNFTAGRIMDMLFVVIGVIITYLIGKE